MNRPRLLIALLALVTGVSAGCASVAGDGTGLGALGLDTVVNEREARAEQRVVVLLDSYADYLTSQWPGIRLPDTTIEAWLDPGYWRAGFEKCASEASGLTVQVDPNTSVFADPPPQTDAQRREFDTAIYLCQGRLPPPTLAINEPGPVEIAWVSNYVQDALPACLRREGVTAPPLSDDPFAIVSGGATPLWNPYEAVRGDAAWARRLQTLCPHPSVLLAALPSLGEAP